MTTDQVHTAIKNGFDTLAQILGKPPVCSAAPAWKCNDTVLATKNKFAFKYNSDCRGREIFYPVVGGEALSQPQIPVTLPTYDEVVGKGGISDANFNDHMLSLLKPSSLNVLTIHAEVEGIAKFELFDDFLKKAKAQNISFVPLGRLLDDSPSTTRAAIISRTIPGREGWLAYQEQRTDERH
jgi:undecaprenyl phosphate-alpha-L-ara4FN deformylase